MAVMRKTLLGLALLATVAVSFMDGPLLSQPSEDLSVRKGAGERPAAKTAAPGPAPAVALTLWKAREPYGPTDVDLFAAHSWQPAVVAPAQRAVEAPMAPPLPFRYLGKMLSDGEVMAFVSQDSRTLLLRRGDALASYKVVDITPERMTLLYIPLNQTQQLPFGSAN
jgi:hypothetical protein